MHRGKVTANRRDPARRRVSVPLDPEVLIEALILARLEALPKRRQLDWVRGLLVNGFLTESRLVRALQAGASAKGDEEQRPRSLAAAGFTFGQWRGRPAQAEPATRPSPVDGRHQHSKPAKPDGPHKPFAHLRKVVG
jgi:hypothetical protein